MKHPAEAPAASHATAGDSHADGEPEPTPESEQPASLGQLVIPFGPFLAIGAAVYAFCEPWLQIRIVGM
jgi:hypothetical protein